MDNGKREGVLKKGKGGERERKDVRMKKETDPTNKSFSFDFGRCGWKNG